MQRDGRWAEGLIVTTSGLSRALKSQIQLEIEGAGGRWEDSNIRLLARERLSVGVC